MITWRVPSGTTSFKRRIFIPDSSSSVGAGLTGLVYNTSGLTAHYSREGASGAATAISLAAATLGTWTSGGFIVVDATNMPGMYELSLPDAALAAGAGHVDVFLKGAANMVPVHIHVILEAIPADVVLISGSAPATALASTSDIADAVHDEAVEGAVTLRQLMRILAAVLAGRVSGAPTGPIVFRDIGNTVDRVTATVDEDGNRLTVTLNAT